jgi:hypothetical protein
MDVEDVWTRGIWGIRGEGQIVAIADTGLSTGNITTPNSLHWDFGQVGSPVSMRVIKGYALGRSTWDDPNPGGGHGTHTSGSIVGNGIRSGSTPSTDTFPTTSFTGIAPKAGFVMQSVMSNPNSGALGGIPADLNNLFLPPYNDGARVHSNSWGAAVNGACPAREPRRFVWTLDMVVVLGRERGGLTARTVINTDSIGSRHRRTAYRWRVRATADFVRSPAASATTLRRRRRDFRPPRQRGPDGEHASGMGAFSSRGPTDDLRFKPEITAPGIAIISTRSNQNQAYEQWGICNVPAAQQTHYLTMGGTSMCEPPHRRGCDPRAAVLRRRLARRRLGRHERDCRYGAGLQPLLCSGQGDAHQRGLGHGARPVRRPAAAAGDPAELGLERDPEARPPEQRRGLRARRPRGSLFPDSGWEERVPPHAGPDETTGIGTGGAATRTGWTAPTR